MGQKQRVEKTKDPLKYTQAEFSVYEASWLRSTQELEKTIKTLQEELDRYKLFALKARDHQTDEFANNTDYSCRDVIKDAEKLVSKKYHDIVKEHNGLLPISIRAVAEGHEIDKKEFYLNGRRCCYCTESGWHHPKTEKFIDFIEGIEKMPHEFHCEDCNKIHPSEIDCQEKL